MATKTKFQFTKAVFSGSSPEDWGWEIVGTLKDLTKGQFLKFTKRNLASTKRVTILISDDKEDFSDAYKISCTEPLSVIVRQAIKDKKTHKQVMAVLLGLDVQASLEDPEKYFLFSPQGDGEMLEAIASTTKVSDWEDLL